MDEDARLSFVYRQVVHAFRHIQIERIDEYFKGETIKRVVYDFLDNPDAQAIFFKEAKGSIEVSDTPQKAAKGMLFYMVKLNKTSLGEESMAKEVVYGDVSSDPLEHLSTISERIFHPIVGSKKTLDVWSETITKDVRDNFDTFVSNVQITQGNIHGVTCLPLPSTGGPKEDDDLNGNRNSDGRAHMQIHALEGAIITWTKQIKNILKLDPESMFTAHKNPGPTAEIEFWKHKAGNLNGIFDQLQSAKVRRVLKVLDLSKSTYNGPFAKLCKEVFHARGEANNIVKYLRPLVAWFDGLENEGDFDKLESHFKPIVHLILLVWKNSAYYNTPARLVIMLRQMCNALIRNACQYLNGDTIFEVIEDGQCSLIVKMLQRILRTFGTFKSVYFEYKLKAAEECPENPWKIQNNALFVRFDAFLERCHDILDLAQTILLFQKLAKTEIGGTKGKTLSTSVAQIYFDFTQAVDYVKNIGSGIMDVDNKEFENAFYEFRNRMKELDRRLGSVIVQGFDDAKTVMGMFRLLESFDNLIHRPLVADQLEKKHGVLIEALQRDIEEVHNLFFDMKETIPIANNLPPIAGALTWSRGLQERAQCPMEKLKSLDSKAQEREDTREVIKMYTSLMGYLADFEKERIDAWGESIEAASQEKLKNPLIRRGDEVISLLYVNFDPILVRLLREVKYFLLLGLDVPMIAREIFAQAEVFRRHTGNLDLIVNMYNDLQSTLLPVERPLVRAQLEKIDRTMLHGIGDGKTGAKSKTLNWKSNGIDVFIGEAMAETKEAVDILQMLKGNLKQVESTVSQWSGIPLFDRSSKTVSVKDFTELQKKVRLARIQKVKEDGQDIHRLLKDTNKRLKVSQGLPDWKAYIDFVNNIVTGGLVNHLVASLKLFAQYLDVKYLEQHNSPALLEVQVDLVGVNVLFMPEVGYREATKTSNIVGINNLIAGWINGMMGTASCFKRLDTGEGTYVRELSGATQVKYQRARISALLTDTEKKANEFREIFKKYEYLWTSDLQALFNEFLDEAVSSESVPFEDNVEDKANTEDTGGEAKESTASGNRGYWKRVTINLDMFNERISKMLKVQTEVNELKPIIEVDFLKFNAQPVKQSISTWVTKWLYQFTQYLQDHVGGKLQELSAFFTAVNQGLDVELEAGDREALMAVMTHIRDVRKRMPEISSVFDPLSAVVSLLKKHNIAIDLPPVGGSSALDFMERATMVWESTVNKAYRVKESIQPNQNSMLEGIRADIKAFQNKVKKFGKDFKDNGPFRWLEKKQKDAFTHLDKYHKELLGYEARAKELNELEDLFELPLSQYLILEDMHEDLKLLKKVWDVALLVESLFAVWRATLWAEIRTDDLVDEVRVIQQQIKRLPRRAKEWLVMKHLDSYVKNMATILPVVHELHSHAMRDRHWKAVMTTTGSFFERGPNFSLSDLIELNLHRHVDAVLDIVEMANKELKIETRLNTIEDVWARLKLSFDQHRDTEVFVVAPPDDILETLEEHSLLLQGMAGMGKFVDFFKSRVIKWQTTLGEVDTVLKYALTVQRSWGSLESIFMGSADIRAQLPDDSKRFEQVDSEFKELMRDLNASTGVVTACCAEGREETLSSMLRELEKCEKALNEYLEVKKGIFPRFYFVSNAALLDILSNGNNPPRIMPHVGSVFDGIGSLELCYTADQTRDLQDDPDMNVGPMMAAKSMHSKDKESVTFQSLFEMVGPVEIWLGELVKHMQITLLNVLSDSMLDAASWETDRPREEWVFQYPAQICVATSQVMWTDETEHALEELESGTEDAVKKYVEVCSGRLESLIKLVQGELSKPDRVKIITVITIDVHNRDVVASLVAKRVESNVDFKWQSQLRYYWNSEDQVCNIRICDFATIYNFEYVGNCGRLVITPLTDRCYVTLTVALRLMLGGAPAGPAGTGKTETTKDLARGLGVICYVFNCSDQMNYQTMGDIFKGLTQVGAWGCFDEFNRIEIEVLSVVATQVRTILEAIAYFAVPSNREKEYASLPAGTPNVKVGEFNFEGSTIALVPCLGFFITMNPGYAGRTELPENLKALFRSCAMIKPDFIPISENMLMAEGFVKARPLSIKFVTLYELSSELLSKQHHYDWGLRAIKSVLRVAGVLKRSDPDFEEDAILMRALRDFNTPKIPSNDIPIFLRLISDLFPGLDLAPKINQSLSDKCVAVCAETNLQPEELFVGKVMQFQELLDVRHSVMLLGPAGCGKTQVWKTLAGCINMGQQKPIAVYETINPKSVTTGELYGYMTLSKDWRDGVLSIVMRNMSKNQSPFTANQSDKWVVLDGDIDAVWIESMNTVMDDNKTLTLVSNERIPLSDAMRMVFEIHTLKNATPATVSRAGILYINDTDVGYQPYIDSWLATRTKEIEKSALPDLFDRYITKIIEFYQMAKTETLMPLPYINLVQTLCYLLDGMLQGLKDLTKESIEFAFVYSAMWAFGGALSSDKQRDYRKEFCSFYKSLVKCVVFPEAGTCMDYFIDPTTGNVVAWSDKIASFVSNAPESANSTIVVPTADSVRVTYLMDLVVKNERPMMFVGSAGTGKTILVNDYLASLSASDESSSFVTINMNFYTDAFALQTQLEQSIDKRSGKTYGPPNGKLVYFVDDLNLPFVETYGTQTPIALMRQHIDHKSWYDRSDVSLKKQIIDCNYVCCMNQKAGSFFVDPRLQRHFVSMALQMPDDSDLSTIFCTILNSHLFSFDKKIQELSQKLIDATIDMYKEIATKFLPSAIKFHYNFTMRDLAAITKGLLLSRPREYTHTGQISRLWYHEATRVFADRLTTELEYNRAKEIAIQVGKRYFEDDPAEVYAEPCLYSNFHAGAEVGTYVNVMDMARLKRKLEEKLEEYNEQYAIMDLVLFETAIMHVTRISRILSFPGGNALLVGVGGSGKQSLSKLSAFICHYDTVQISVTAEYSVNDLKENLREMYKKAGVKPGVPLMFLLTDSQITDEKFLVYINDLLSSGRIPDLFTGEEYDGIFNSLRNIAKSEGVPDNRDSMMDFFINRVRQNLHVVLCFSPVGDAFRQRARKFPGIINCTAIDWFHEWPKDALVSVATKFLDDLETGGRPETKDNIAYHIAEVHASVSAASVEYLAQERRFNYTTPKSFLELIAFYKQLLKQRRGEMFDGIKRLDTGLDTLERTNEDVAKLKDFLKVKKVEVEAKKAATDELLEAMGEQRQEAEQQEALADIEKQKADVAAGEARALEQQAAGDLAVAKPAMDAANDAVNCLDKGSMTELKSFTKPPNGVDKVTGALLIMIKGEKKDFSWDNAKKMMAKVDAFKEKLETYRGEDIPDDVVNRVNPILADPDFTYEKMKSKSAAAANLCNWVVNIVKYNGIYKRVKPLMDSLEIASKSKQKAEDDLAAVNEILSGIQAKLNKLQVTFRAATEEKAKVEAEAKECQDRLDLAERLINGLSSEKVRWTSSVEALRRSEITMAGDVMLAAAFTSYLGAFGATFRNKLWKETWIPDLIQRDVPITAEIDPFYVLTDDAETAKWQNEHLPADRISLENGAILTNCNRWPLLIDPQLQGIRWLKTHEEKKCSASDRKMHIMRIGEKQWMFKLVQAIQAGDCVILENVGENLDASLEPILSKAYFRKGRSLYLKLGENEVEYDENFQLYLQTKLSNPHYKPETFAQCTLINFIVTRKGLEDQLLAVIVSEEEPELEKTRNELVQSFNDYKIQLKSLEDQLLERLANAPEDILSDIPLIEGLEQTKATANEINEAVEKGKITEVGINEAREVYRIVATEAALMYFVMLQLCLVNHMYQYSLDSFTFFFLKALKIAEPNEDKLGRVMLLQETLRWTVYKWVCRGLFEKDRLIFLTQFTFSLLAQEIIGEDTGFEAPLYRHFLLGLKETPLPTSPLDWMTNDMWAGIKSLSTIEGFERLPNDIEENPSRFLEWCQHFTPENEKLPMDWRELDKTPFRKLMVVRVLRPDRITSALNQFIREILPNGKNFVECDADYSGFEILEQCYEDSDPLIPLYFILSPGSRVNADVDKLASKMGKRKGETYHNISLGQGQDAVAEEKLRDGVRQGHWVFLQNVHLMPRWLRVLEKKIDEYAETGTHDDFRILLSSDPSQSIPIGILDRAIKITSDPPSGLKANLKQAFASFSRDTYEDLEPRTKGILFGLCQFHAVMVERKKFGTKGYNMVYPFSVGDLVCSAAVLRNYMESAPAKVPWADLRYLFGEIMYGGHIVNDFDRLLANTYLDFFMKDELLDEMPLFPYLDSSSGVEAFRAPSTSNGYDNVVEHIDDELKAETPVAFGLHPNAEIGFRTQQSELLLKTVLELSASSNEGGGGEGQSMQAVAEQALQDILDSYRDVKFEADAIIGNCDEVGPFQNVVLQECERMNGLIGEVVRSLVELDMGFKGDLTMSDKMEQLANALFLNRVDKTWEKLAYPSMRALASWLSDLQLRINQLTEWSTTPSETPIVTWISGLFNPQSFLTAIMQISAQAGGLELDKLTLLTDITKKMAAEEMTQPAREGTYVTGICIEGGSWNMNAGLLESAKPREMFSVLPVINVRPSIVDKVDNSVYNCPVYKTQMRGPTYVCNFQLKTKADVGKWVLSGVVGLLDVSG